MKYLTNREMLNNLNDEEFSQTIVSTIKNLRDELRYNELDENAILAIEFEEWLGDEVI